MSDWNEEANIAKAKRKGIIELRPVGNWKKKKPRPWLVKYNHNDYTSIVHKALTQEDAQKWIDKQTRSFFASIRWSQEWIDRAKKRQEERIARYRIVFEEKK